MVELNTCGSGQYFGGKWNYDGCMYVCMQVVCSNDVFGRVNELLRGSGDCFISL